MGAQEGIVLVIVIVHGNYSLYILVVDQIMRHSSF